MKLCDDCAHYRINDGTCDPLDPSDEFPVYCEDFAKKIIKQNALDMDRAQYIDFLMANKAHADHISWASSHDIRSFKELWRRYKKPEWMFWVLDRLELSGNFNQRHVIVACGIEILEFLYGKFSVEDQCVNFCHALRQFLQMMISVDDFQGMITTVVANKKSAFAAFMELGTELDYSRYLYYTATEILMEYALDGILDDGESSDLSQFIEHCVICTVYYSKHKSFMAFSDESMSNAYASNTRFIASIIHREFQF